MTFADGRESMSMSISIAEALDARSSVRAGVVAGKWNRVESDQHFNTFTLLPTLAILHL